MIKIEVFLPWIVGFAFVLYVFWIKTFPISSIVFAILFTVYFWGSSQKNVESRIGFLGRLVYSPGCVAGLSIAVFLIWYFLIYGQHADGSKIWLGWWDQSQYMIIAKNLSRFAIVPGQYFYGLGYPILGVFFYKFYPADPFLIPNLVMYLLTSLLYFSAFRKYLSENLAFMAILLMLGATPLIYFFVVPWNNSVTVIGMGILIYLGSVVKEIRLAHAVTIGLVLGWVFAARYVDVFFLLPITFYIYMREIRRSRKQIKLALMSSCIAFGIFCIVLFTHQYAFGSILKTPYHMHIQPGGHSDQSLSAFQISRVPDHLYSIIINPYQFHSLKHASINTPLLGYSFFFVFSMAGFSYLILCRRNWMFAVILVTMVVCFVFYGSFSSTKGSDLKYNCLRYFALWYPLLTLAAVLGISKLVIFSGLMKREKRAILLGVLITVLGVLSAYSYLKYSDIKTKSKILDSSSWVVSSNYNTQNAKLAIDTVPVTRWDSGVPQRPGIYFLIDLGAVFKIDLVKLRLFYSPNDYPRGLEVETSIDGSMWRKSFSFPELKPHLLLEGDVQFNLGGVRTRYVKLLQTKRSSKWFWSIHELEIYCE